MDRHTRLPAVTSALILAGSLACSCGGHARQAPATRDDSGVDAGEVTADASPDAGNHDFLGGVRGVPAGDVFVGSWIFNAKGQQFRRPTGCSAAGELGQDRGANRRLTVGQFWLQQSPVSNGLYAICFASGACTAPDHDIADPNPKSWDDPARVELPVYVTHDQAVAYCDWAKGRLPTVAELTRAAQGDAEVPGVAALTQAAIDCANEVNEGAGASELCGQLQLMNYFQTPSPPLYRTNAVELDRGPYGHTDLFGSVWEWTQSFGGFADDGKFCSLSDGSPDFVTFDPNHELTQSDVLGFASVLMDAINSGSAFPARLVANATNRYNIGFRCAFDNMQ